MIYRELSKKDYLLYKEIRLELLENNPTSFGSSHEDEAKFDDEKWIERLTKNHVHTIGAFKKTKLIGIAVLVQSPRTKMNHIATINSMYVQPSYRNKGIAYGLIQFAEKIALKHGTERLNLSVVTTNTAAHNLYKKIGFIDYGIEPCIIKYNNVYYDLQIMSKIIKDS